MPDDVPDTTISVKDPLEIAAVDNPTQLPDNLNWTKWNCYFHDPTPTADWDSQLNAAQRCPSPNQSLFEDTISETSEPPLPTPAPRGRPPSGKNKAAKSQLPMPKVVEVSTPCSEKSSSSREHATPSSRASSPLFSTPSSTLRKQSDLDASLLTPTLSDDGMTLKHITQISPVCFFDTSPTEKERGFLVTEPISPMGFPGTPLHDETDGDIQSTLSNSPPQARRDLSTSSHRSTTTEVQKKVEKKKRQIQSTTTFSSSSENEPPVKKKEIFVPSLGPTPRVIRTVPSDAILVCIFSLPC